ncbi:MAG: hypothetical protein B9J98_00225 [Candidatus Terraquivivens tikiterensis]|uniref:DUF72 domain-containing protein n=1 Tax=Candidatus Terraquivivens tikiterensis TaxID=1980982 RepID=A0A2R7YAH0_9ARCH|nr:MAG: hypothetical protein B9J98_00225 [Candidatus Terraquivivens tikiterensis]
MKAQVLIGCCGWAIKGGKHAYYNSLKTIELQETFYRLPKLETAKRWRESAPRGFVFNMKAWQAITHPPSSPTWRRAGIKVPEGMRENYGNLRPTRENLEAWSRTVEVARAIEAAVVVVQTPSSFGYTEKNFENADKFFDSIRHEGFEIGWEPRGSWRDRPDAVKELCERHGLIHVTDVFRWRPVHKHRWLYTRLHGIGSGEVNYSYRYTDEDLERLRQTVLEESEGREACYVLFNNVSMAEDALRFRRLLEAFI